MAIVRSTKRGCGTCRDRKILCDRAQPSCQQCLRSKRKCKGYGQPLFWPRAADGKRAIVAKATAHESTPHRIDVRLVNVRCWDVEMHYWLKASLPKAHSRPILWIPLPWNPCLIDARDQDLFQYFQCVASQALPVFGHDPTPLVDFLMRIALTSGSPSCKAVLQSLLALASLHRYGIQSHAIELKISSLKALSDAARHSFGAVEVIQHIAAGMLLCSFEVHQSSCTSSQWTFYISGVKEVIDIACRRCNIDFCQDKDVKPLLNWVHYHDVLTRFTLRHWRGTTTRVPLDPTDNWTDSVCVQMPPARTPYLKLQLPYLAPESMAALGSLSEICDVLLPSTKGISSTEALEEYKAYLKVLDWRLRSIHVSPTTSHTMEATTIAEIYRLAILVYLHRASGHIFDQDARTQEHIDKAFNMFSKLGACERQFPIFILGCEASTDSQRLVTLDLIARTEQKISSRSITQVKLLLHATWAQEDLADGKLDYWTKITSIISSCSIMPSLV